MSKKVEIAYQFVVPADAVLASARTMATSTTPDEEAVGKAVLAVTEVTKNTQAAIADTVSEGTYDLAVYLDYKFGPSLEAANRLLTSSEPAVRNVAKTLIAQSEAIAASKAAFVAATISGHWREIGGNRFWCEPKKTSGIQDPTRPTYTDADGNEYWCIPENELPRGRRYDGTGPIPPYPTHQD